MNIRESDITGRALIHYKEPVQKSHMFESQITVTVL